MLKKMSFLSTGKTENTTSGGIIWAVFRFSDIGRFSEDGKGFCRFLVFGSLDFNWVFKDTILVRRVGFRSWASDFGRFSKDTRFEWFTLDFGFFDIEWSVRNFLCFSE